MAKMKNWNIFKKGSGELENCKNDSNIPFPLLYFPFEKFFVFPIFQEVHIWLNFIS